MNAKEILEEKKWEPRIVAFFCTWCTYTAADLAGVSRLRHAPNARIIRVMCSGRIDPQFVLDAFARGADGVLIGGCHPGDCHYMEGNTKALRRVRALQRLLRDMGVHEDRFRLEWISASEGEKVKTVINDMVERIRVLGPLSLPAHCAQWDAEVGSLERAIAAEQKQADGDAGVQIPSSPPAAVGADQTQESSSLPQHHSGAKPKIALYWCASCGGCEESVVDLAEGIIGLLATIDIVFWPVAMDFKKSDVEKLGDGEIFASLINGAVRTSEQEEMAHLLRRKSRIVLAYGSCAHLGGIPGLANQFNRDDILRYVYEGSPSTVNEEKTRPLVTTQRDTHTLTIPAFHSQVRTLNQVIPVDYYLPGCPPVPRLLAAGLAQLLSDNPPPRGSVLAPDTALCDTCPRKDTKPADLQFTSFSRPHQINIDPAMCFLAQGVVCMGPGTRGGCEAQCINGNMPCSGCFGPPSNVRDQGAKVLAAIFSSLKAKDEKGIDEAAGTVPDPIGTFYRYGLPGSLLRRKTMETHTKG